MDSDAICFEMEQDYDVPAPVVWKAITDAAQMRQWFFEPMSAFEAVVGFETEFDVSHEGRVFTHQWKIIEVIPERRIAYDWKYAGIPGESVVTWELVETDGGSRLTLTCTGLESFPQDDPVFSLESCRAGWDYLLRESLSAFLARL